MTKSKTKQCQNCKIKFTIEPEDFEFYKKMDVPEPTFCSECRAQRRFSFRNERKLYKRKCDFSGKEIFSMFSPKAKVKVYEKEIWWSDKWDSMEYGKDYDFKKPFFKQFQELRKEVPWVNRPCQNMINSDYCMNAQDFKNCYLVFVGNDNEDCAYIHATFYNKDCYDGAYLSKCELCYETFMIAGCYKTFFSFYCNECQDVFFSTNCMNCSNCFGCANLKHKKYHIFNKPYTKEEYFKKLEEFNLGSYKNILSLDKKAKDFWMKFPVKFAHSSHNVNADGEDVYNSKNILDSYSISKSENLKYCQFIYNGQDSYDYTSFGENARLIYEVTGAGNGINGIRFSFFVVNNCRNIEYSMECFSSSNLFGCAGLRHKKYCILNKQYTKKEYEELVPKIKQHMNDMPYTDKKGRVYKYGEFFPIELSPFGYNETIANEYFPLTKEQVLKKGYTWYDKPKPEYKATIKAANLPDNIKDVDDSILKEVIECSSSNCVGSTVFRIIPTELKFYQKQNIPLPRLCPDCRHRERIKQRNPMKLWKRQCMCAGHEDDTKTYKNTIEHPHHKDKHCPNEFETTYAPDRKEIVYCEKCYNKEAG